MHYAFENLSKMGIILKTGNPVLTVPIAELKKTAHCNNGSEGSEVTYALEMWVYCSSRNPAG